MNEERDAMERLLQLMLDSRYITPFQMGYTMGVIDVILGWQGQVAISEREKEKEK